MASIDVLIVWWGRLRNLWVAGLGIGLARIQGKSLVEHSCARVRVWRS